MLLIPAALAAEVVVFGDSWAEGSADELEDILQARGYARSVDPQGVGGTTAEYWATVAPATLPTVLVANQDAKWVWLSIGGNDLFAHYYAGNGANNAADYERNLRSMLDGAFAVRPDVKIVSFGYDFVNFEQSQECILTAWAYFGTSVTSATVNQLFLDEIGAIQARVSADYPNYHYVDRVWGTLQAAGGIPGAPNVLFPSPARYMSDCIHPTSEGYSLIHSAFVGAYWGESAPIADFTPKQQDWCVGETATFTSTALGADRRRWSVDGVYQGAGPSISVPITGNHRLSLVADGGAWEDEEVLDLRGYETPSGTISGPQEVEEGDEAWYTVSVPQGGTAVWSVQGGSILDDQGDSVQVRWDSEGAGLLSVDVTAPGGCAGHAESSVQIAAAPDSATDDSDPDSSAPQDSKKTGEDPESCGCQTAPASLSGLVFLFAFLRRRHLPA
ncbi:MAG TPA: SGNH/GDSL hydrolase family protein [Myxococcota bacterium]|nr:SGNH/GDSL hydrolase family protein [Myxococcota bacterium]